MASYDTLKGAVQQVIKQNGQNEITGDLLQQTLLAMINSLGAKFQFAGIATPSTDPGTPDQNVAYIAGPGTYPNFNSTTIPSQYMGVFCYNGSWTYSMFQTSSIALQTVSDGIVQLMDGDNPIYPRTKAEAVFFGNDQTDTLDEKIEDIGRQVIYDISAKNPTAGPNNDGKFTLEYILNQNNVNTLIPAAVRCGGMSIRFVLTSDNKYVQYRLMSATFNTTEANWQGVDDEITQNSNNLIKSGGVSNVIYGETIESHLNNLITAEQEGYYFDIDGRVKPSSSFAYTIIELTSTTFTIRGSNTVNSLGLRLDKNKNVLSTFAGWSAYLNGTFQTDNAKYVAISFQYATDNNIVFSQPSGGIESEIRELENRTIDNEEAISEVSEDIAPILDGEETDYRLSDNIEESGYYIDYNGVKYANSAFSYSKIALTFSSFKVSGSVTSKGTCGIFLGENEDYLDCFANWPTTLNGTYNVIPGAKYIIISFQTTNDANIVVSQKTEGDITKLNNRVVSLESSLTEISNEIIQIINSLNIKNTDKTNGLHCAILGDSITWLGGDNCDGTRSGYLHRGWTEYFKNNTHFATIKSYARSGATWSHTANTEYDIIEDVSSLSDDNVIYNQINRLKAYTDNGGVIPNLIIIAAGTNDAWYPNARPNATSVSANTAFLDESGYITSRNVNTLTSIAEAMRYDVELLKTYYPECQVVILTPLQSTAFTAERGQIVGDIIEECSRYLACSFIRQDTKCCIYRAQENVSYYNTADGTHPSIVGAEKIGRVIANVIKGILQY